MNKKNIKDAKPKDKKIQYYTPQRDKIDGKIEWKKVYPYDKSKYDEGGLWAYVRQLQASEKFQAGMSVDKTVLKAEINYNKRINNQMKAVFKGEIYDVGLPDDYEFYTDRTNLTLTSSIDNNNYTAEDEFDDES